MLKRALQQSKSTPIPVGYRQLSIKKPGCKKPHTYIECTRIIHSKHGDFPCCYSKRKDSVPKNVSLEEALHHKCFNNNLDRYVDKNVELEVETKEPSDAIKEKLYALTGRYGIAIEIAVGKLMRNLIFTAIKIGQENPTADIETLTPLLNRKSFTKDLIRRGKLLYEEVKNQYLEYKFVCLNVDAGKLGSTNYFDVIIANSLIPIKPIIYKAFSHFRGDSFDYKSKLNHVIEELEAEGFTVAGIVSDGLRVQVNAILDIIQNSHFLFHVSCGDHAIHNALKDAFRQSEELNKMLSDLENFTILMNHKDILSKIQISIPKRCMTRWTNVYDISYYIVEHYETICEFFNTEENYLLPSMKDSDDLESAYNIITKSCFILTMILKPLKTLSLKLESDHTTCGYIFGYEYSVLIKLTQLGIQFPILEEYCNLLAECVKQRLFEKHDSLQNRLAFVLTPKGREIEIMLENNSPKTEIDAAFSNYFPLDDPKESEIFEFCSEKLNEEQDFPILKIKIESEDDNESENDNESEDDNIAEAATDNLIEEESEEEIIEEIDGETIEEIIDFQGKLIDKEAEDEMQDAPISNYVEITEPELYTIDDYGLFLIENCPKFQLDGEKASLALSKWLSNPTALSKNMLLHLKNDGLLEVLQFFQKLEEFKDLATFARILLTNTSSEAACEREFWKQRKILTNEKNRTGQELAFTRIVFMTLDEQLDA